MNLPCLLCPHFQTEHRGACGVRVCECPGFEPACRTCRANPAQVKGECGTCHQYRRRHQGEPRPKELIERQPDLNYRREMGRPA